MFPFYWMMFGNINVIANCCCGGHPLTYSLLVLCHKKKKKKLGSSEFWDVLGHEGSTWGSLRIQEMKAALVGRM